MKQKIYILGLISAIIISTGLIFKVEHWPLAQIFIASGIFMLVVIFLPAALIDSYNAEVEKHNGLLLQLILPVLSFSPECYLKYNIGHLRVSHC